MCWEKEEENIVPMKQQLGQIYYEDAANHLGYYTKNESYNFRYQIPDIYAVINRLGYLYSVNIENGQ